MSFLIESKIRLRVVGLVLLILLNAICALGAGVPSGYSEYYIPGNETYMRSIFNIVTADATANQHTVITVTAWSKNTTIYYDHWENGYLFNPANPDANAQAGTNPPTPISAKVEKYALANRGDSLIFESGNIPSNPRTSSTLAYDGEDRIYVVGGSATVTRASWNENSGTLLAIAWDVYPVRPQLTTYINPFGEDLAITTGANLQDFQYVATLIQATADGTTVQVDLDHNGTYDTLYNVNRTTRPPTIGASIGNSITLSKGQSFLLDRYSANTSLNTGAIINSNNTIQVQYGIGKPGSNYQARGASAFPRGFWDTDYYAPVHGFSATYDNGGGNTIHAGDVDVYLYNPWSYAITINYETTTGTGSFTIPATSTASFNTATGNYVPLNSGVYFHGSDAFWGISSIDTSGHDAAATGQGKVHEWAYALVPSILMENDHFMGWAPACYAYNAGAGTGDPDATSRTDSGVFLATTQDNVHVFVDYDHNGTVDQNYTLNRLQSQYMYNPNVPTGGAPGGMSNVEIYATGNFTMSYGQNPDLAPPSAPAMDLGYTALPGTTFIELVLAVHKSVSPSVVPTASGSSTTFTLEVDTGKYPVDSISVVDTLPPYWNYVNGTDTTTITFADNTTGITNPTKTGSGTPADPYILTWSTNVLGGMQPNQKIYITFTARTTQAFAVGDISRNYVEASGTRTVGGVTQTFVTSDFAFVTYGNYSMTKTSSVPATTPLYPGDAYTYTIIIDNPVGGTTLTGVSLYDQLPDGISYVPSSSSLSIVTDKHVRDQFDTTPATYSENDGPDNWSAAWVEGGDGGSPTGGNIQIVGQQLRIQRPGRTISRAVDLTNMSSATLSFNWSTSSSVVATDVAVVQMSTGGTGGTFTTIGTFTNLTGVQSGSASYSINGYIGTNTAVRFTTTTGYANSSAKYFFVDNVDIQATGTTTPATAAGTPPDLISSSSGYSLAQEQTLTLTYNVTVDNPLPTGINQILNTASVTSTQFPVPLTASAPNIVSTPETISAEIGDRVWFDTNGDGVQDVGEPGLANVEVTLKDQFGTPVATTTTNSTGYYLFSNVTPENGYYVQVTGGLPSGLVQSSDSRLDNRTNSFNLLSSQNYRDNFGSVAYNNSDGSLSWASTPWTENNDNSNPASGNILITTTGTRELQINNNNAGADNSIQRSVNIPNNAVSAIVSFNYRTTAGVDAADSLILEISKDGGTSWVTLNNYTGTAGVTSGVGSFNITNYATPNTIIRFRTNGASYTDTAANESFLVDNFDVTYKTLSAPSYLNADIGYETSGSTAIIGDKVWSDANGNGLLDPGETGLSGVTLNLYYDTNGDGIINDGQTPVSTVTGPDGSYLFTGVTANGTRDYIVSIDESTLSAYNRTTPGTSTFGIQNPVSGGAYLNADFGYQQKTSGTTFSIRDRVWFDNGQGSGGVASDGLQNGTEAGIAGVTVALLDASNNVIATTTTDSSGNFQFTGVPGGKNYGWQITDQAGVLASYYGTTASALSGKFQMTGNLTGNLDYTSSPHFGYNLSRAIGDTVFNDSGAGGGTYNNGIQDGTEPGISGVTVKLYNDLNLNGIVDSTDTLIGTLVTDANGKYLFTGLGAGNYLVNIDNAQAVLSGYTLYAGHTDPRAITLTGTDSNFTADFGYHATTPRKIAGTIWSDANQNGVMDSAESKIANVTVQLLQGGTVIGSTTTNSSGYYEFAGLPSPGTYTVKITDTNGVLADATQTYDYDVGTGTPKDGQATTKNTTGDETGINFGYYQPRPTYALISSFKAYTASGSVIIEWETSAEVRTAGFNLTRFDASTGTYEQVNQKVIPSVMRPQGGVYQCVDKDAATGGAYTYKLVEKEFSGKSRVYGPYSVTVDGISALNSSTDTAQLFKTGRYRYSHKLKKTAFSAEAAAEVSSHLPVNTRQMAHVMATAKTATALSASQPASTGSTVASAAVIPIGQLKIYTNDAGLYQISAADIATGFSVTQNQAQDWIAADMILISNMGGAVSYLPFEDHTGLYFYAKQYSTIYTDYNVYWLSIQSSPSGGSKGDINGDGKVDSADAAICLDVLSGKANPNIRPDYAASGADVNGNGKIDMAELAYITDPMRKPGGSTSMVMKTVSGQQPAPVAVNSFETKMHVEQDVFALTNLFDNPETDYWFWNFIFPGDPDFGAAEFSFEAAGVAGASTTDVLKVYMQGMVDAPNHVHVLLNSTLLGEMLWNGSTPSSQEFSFNQQLLTEGSNTVRIEGIVDPGVDLAAFAVNGFDLTYHRLYKAANDCLAFSSDGFAAITVSGFSGVGIDLFDLSDPAHPKQVIDTTIDQSADGYRVSFKPSGANVMYLAVLASASKTPDAMSMATPAGLKDSSNKGNYLIITTDDLKAAAQGLADYRQSHGLTAKIVTIGDIFDEFNYGIYNPHAIHDFIAYAAANWNMPPTYVVLVGDGNYDYKNHLLTGDNLVPVLMVGTPYGLFSGDNLYVDTNNDGMPNLPIGRIPADTAGQLTQAIVKIANYEAGMAGNKHAIMVADRPDTGGNFPTDSDAVSAFIPAPPYTVDKIYLPGMTNDQAHQQLVDGINAGSYLVNYIGHGGYDVLSQYPGIFTIADATGLTNSQQYPLFVALTCLVGGFSIPGADSLSEVMMLKDNGGSIASWSPSGLSINDDAVMMNKDLFTAIFTEGSPDMGNAILRAIQLYHAGSYTPFMINIYNLLGDPALKIH